MNIYHVAPVSKHLERHFTGCDQKDDLFVRVCVDNVKYFFANVVDCRNEKGDHIFIGERMDSFAYEALAADRMIGIMDALCCEPARGALKGFVAVGEADNEQRVFFA